MSASIVTGVVPTYAALLAAYPENGAALAALPTGTAFFVEDQACAVRRSATGEYWVPVSAPNGPRFTGTNAHWVGPALAFGMTTSASQARKVFRPVYYRMPGFRPATISRISLYQGAAPGSVTSGTDAFVLRLYPANPDGSPMVGAAPLFVWNFTGAGDSGTSTLSLTNAGNNATRMHADLYGGAKLVPPHFWLAFGHNLDTTAPTLGCMQIGTLPLENMPGNLNGTDLSNDVAPNRATGYTWTEVSAWTVGDMAVWPAGAEYTYSAAVAPHLKVTD